ncbi:MAG: hypothetical protein IJL32_02160 [Oscillospiraceae bacterium]|nr:hypothetical protein [Oscillospiraceae bacterium]
MSKSILSKVAAIACGVASVAVLTVTATAAKTVLEVNKTNYPEIKDGQLNFVATRVTVDESDVKAAADGYVISYSVEIANNTGYASAGVAVVYDSKLTPVMNGENVKYEKGDAGSGIGVVKENLSKHLVGCGASTMENVTANGKYITIDFKLPKDAKVGDKYPMTWDIDSVIDANDEDVTWNEVDGYIEIVKDPTPITTTVITTTTPAPTTSTTVPTTTVTVPTTSKPVDTIVTTTITTTTGATGSRTTNTTASNTTAKATTTKAANGGNNTNSTKTGDAGAGVAAAALLLAAGTAVAAGKKKKD